MTDTATLDAEIAEEVIGWKRIPQPADVRNWESYPQVWYEFEGWRYNVTEIPKYSTDIRAAFKVVAEMERQGWNYTVGSFAPGLHQAGFGRVPMDSPVRKQGDWVGETAATPAEAICRAALKAVREQVKGGEG